MLRMEPDFASYQAAKELFLKQNDLWPEARCNHAMRECVREGMSFEQFRDMLTGPDLWRDSLKESYAAIQRNTPKPVDPFIQGFTKGD